MICRTTLSLGLAYLIAALPAPGEPVGQRQPWTTSRITGSLEPPPPYRVERMWNPLQLEQPVVLARAPGLDRWFVLELRGKLYSFAEEPGDLPKDLTLDLSQAVPGFRRAYGLAFHPRFPENRSCYLCYVLADNDPSGTHVSRFTVDLLDPPRIDPNSEKVLLTWYAGGHNGGCLAFGPDGCLYISTGDASGPFPADIRNTGQDLDDLEATILRIDVDRADSGRPYGVPKDNPFVGIEGARPEIWAYGFRNPWKMDFDPRSGALWVGDVGWELWELVHRVERGGNHGWSIMEGSQPVHPERQRGLTPIVPPVVQHSHVEARSITGGCVYHGRRLPELAGAYVYGDYVTGKLWGLRHDGRNVTWHQELADTSLQVICFATDPAGEVLVMDYTGAIGRLVPAPAQGFNPDFPRRLSQTGLFESVAEHRPAPGVLRYTINAEPWMDHAVAERLVALSGSSRLGTYEVQDVQAGIVKGAWEFPNDAVLAKTISIEEERGNPASRRRLETQILHRDGDTWRAYDYLWTDDQTDALLADAQGSVRTLSVRDPQAPGGVRQQTWRLPSRAECILCHTTRVGSILGFEISQLDDATDATGTDGGQLERLERLGVFAKPLPADRNRLAKPAAETSPLADRARAYLHVNCAHCHCRGGGGTAAIELPAHLPLEKTHLLASRPTQGTFGIAGALVVAPGEPCRSVLYYRMATLGGGRMPHFGSSVVDPEGLRLVHDWIVQLAAPGQAAGPVSRGARPAERSGGAIERWFGSTTAALALVALLDQGAIDPAVRDQVVHRGAQHPAPEIRGLFDRFIPESQRAQRLGSAVQPAQILALEGEIERGRRLFFESEGLACRNCHRIAGAGRSVGPDLDGVGKRLDRAKMLEAILDPSRTVDPKFLAYALETANGEVLTGLLEQKTPQEVVLKNATGQLVRVPAAEVGMLAPQPKSLMPDLLVRDLTAQDLADLLAFLAALR